MKGGLRTGVNIAARNYPGARGIKNLGNTCFLNVVLQSLSSLGSFHLYLDSGAPPTTTPLAQALRESMQALSRSSSSSYDPTPMVTRVPVLQNTFAHGQHDPEELLHHLMAILDAEKGSASKPCADREETRASSTTTQSSTEKKWDNVGRRSRRTGFDENPFAGRLVSKITCKRCNEERSQKHSFIDLSLSIPSGIRSPSLTNCLSLFTQTEELTGVRCDRCIADQRQYRQHVKKQLERPVKTRSEDDPRPDPRPNPFKSFSILGLKNPDLIDVGLLSVDKWPTTVATVLRAEKKLSIAKSPRALCLHIQRLVAQPGYRDTMFVKRDDKVRFEPILDLSPFCEQSEIKYLLAAVIVHHGSEDGGHFTVYRRKLVPTENYAQLLQCAASTSISSTDWVHISDEICQRVSEEKVLTAPAYMLFYEKRDVCQ